MLSKRQVVVGLGVLSFVPLIVAIALGLMSVQLNSRQLEAFAVLSTPGAVIGLGLFIWAGIRLKPPAETTERGASVPPEKRSDPKTVSE